MYSGYDGYGGASLNIGPEELARLDASQLEPSAAAAPYAAAGAFRPRDMNAQPDADSTSLALQKAHFRHLEDSIRGTLAALNSEVLGPPAGGPAQTPAGYRAALEMMNPIGGPLHPTPRSIAYGVENDPALSPRPKEAAAFYPHGAPYDMPPNGVPYASSSNADAAPYGASSHAPFASSPNMNGMPYGSAPYAPSSSSGAPRYGGGVGMHANQQMRASGQAPGAAPYDAAQGGRRYGDLRQQGADARHYYGAGARSAAHDRRGAPPGDMGPLTPPPSARTPGGDPVVAKVQELMMGGDAGLSPRMGSSEGSVQQERRADEDYRGQLGRLQADLDRVLRQHEHVIRLKNEIEAGLQAELEDARREAAAARDAHDADRERYRGAIRELRQRIRGLQAQIQRLERDGDAGGAGDAAARLQREFDERVAQMARSFEQEKEAAMANLKARVRSELNLLIQRVKDSCRAAIAKHVSDARSAMAADFRSQMETRLREARAEHAAERRVIVRQARERAESETRETMERMRAHYELKIMDVRNACERRVLERLRGGAGLCDGPRDDTLDSLDL